MLSIKKLKENKLLVLFFLIYMTSIFGLTFFHEPWRDEAQQWLIARDLDVLGVVKQMQYEGHFVLWYFILMPFAKLGFSFWTENIISCFFVLISAVLILIKSPFSKAKKILLLFSTPMIYLYPEISRSYCLIPLAITLISMFYKDRYIKPKRYILSIVLLVNTHIIMLGMVVYLLLDFYYGYFKQKNSFNDKEKKYIKLSIILSIILVVMSGVPLVGCLTKNKDIGTPYTFTNKIVNAIFIQPLMLLQKNYINFANIEIILGVIITSVIIVIFYEIRNYKNEFLKIYLILLWQFLIYGFLYGMSAQRAGTVMFIILFFWWNREETINSSIINNYIKNVAIMLLLGCSVFNGLIYCYEDIKYNYSSAKETTEFIRNNIDENAVILVGNQPEFCGQIIAEIDNPKFYFIQRQDYFTYITLDEINRKNLTIEEFENAKDKFKDKELYYIYEPIDVTENFNKKVIKELEDNNLIKKIYESSKSIRKEDYIIYKIKSEQ